MTYNIVFRKTFVFFTPSIVTIFSYAQVKTFPPYLHSIDNTLYTPVCIAVIAIELLARRKRI
jgi:hypothetical protein